MLALLLWSSLLQGEQVVFVVKSTVRRVKLFLWSSLLQGESSCYFGQVYCKESQVVILVKSTVRRVRLLLCTYNKM